MKCNLNIYEIIGSTVYIRTYEKGVERETGACGSGCVAVAYAIFSDNLDLGKPLKNCKIQFITASGEQLEVLHENNRVYLSGNVNYL